MRGEKYYVCVYICEDGFTMAEQYEEWRHEKQQSDKKDSSFQLNDFEHGKKINSIKSKIYILN